MQIGGFFVWNPYFYRMQNTSKDPLHGVTLQMMLEKLVDFYGFDTLSELIKIKCFTDNPSVKSSLTFLRKTPWARTKVEALYVRSIPKFGS
jgi:uncharacterized protein (DUF2132 family)